MTSAEYKEAIMSYYTEKVILAINEQERLMQIMLNKQILYEDMKTQITDLYMRGTEKLQKQNPELFMNIDGKSKFEIGNQVIQEFLTNKKLYEYKVDKSNSIPELKMAGLLESEMFEIELDFYKSFIEFNNRVLYDRNSTFSREYQVKIQEYAKSGWFFYYLASPDLPLLHEFCDEQYLCETFTVENCLNLRTLLSLWFTQGDPSDSLRRKIKDLDDVIEQINNGGYRSAARNIFALIESESENCSNAFKKYDNKPKNLSSGGDRAKEIERIINSINIDWYKKTWKDINEYYKKACSAKHYPGIVNRNSLIHGDYYNNHLDVSLIDVVKLLIMWINYRMISDFIQYAAELEIDLFQYVQVGLAHRIDAQTRK
jgi:hypothetical protein